jgi:hypothetical protein
MVEDNPLDLENTKERQDHDEKLMQSTVKYPEWYTRKSINDVDNILCYINSLSAMDGRDRPLKN